MYGYKIGRKILVTFLSPRTESIIVLLATRISYTTAEKQSMCLQVFVSTLNDIVLFIDRV